MRLTLGITDLFEAFEGRIFSASEVEHSKPAPDLFVHAATQMRVTPEAAVVIEDSVAGVTAAGAACMRCFEYGGGLTPRSALLDAGAIVFDEMSELPGRIAAIT